MRVLSVSRGADVAGSGIGLARAFAAHAPDVTFRSSVGKDNYIGYPGDLPWAEASAAWQQADVVQLHDGFITADMFEKRYGTRPYVVLYHGTKLRSDPDYRLTEQRRRGAVGLVSTIDLTLLAPGELEWQPLPVDLEVMRTLRLMHYEPSDRVRIVHAPTARDLKSTEHVLAACDQLIAEGYPIQFRLIEHQPWNACLAAKAGADLLVDQVILGYGMNALECWAMGMPVIAGADDATLDEMERRLGQLPFYHATESTLYDAIREMVESETLRRQYGDLGRQYVETHHHPAAVVSQLLPIYQGAASQAVAA